MAAIFDSLLVSTSDSCHTSPVVFPDPVNIGIAVGISLLSCIEAEIYTMSYLLPVNGRHLGFMTHTYIGQHTHLFSVCIRWIFVAIM